MNNTADNDRLCKSIGYSFRDQSLLVTALTHSSYGNEHELSYRDNNERLEFLGDAFLDAVIAEELYKRLSERHEGDLSRLRAQIVCERSLIRKAEEISLLDCMRLGVGESRSAARGRAGALEADALEAVFGAVFLDGGYTEVKRIILRLFGDLIDEALKGRLNEDYKTALHERFPSAGKEHLKYVVIKEEGPDHDKTFYVEVLNDGVPIGRGSGSSKKRAEQAAAANALESLDK